MVNFWLVFFIFWLLLPSGFVVLFEYPETYFNLKYELKLCVCVRVGSLSPFLSWWLTLISLLLLNSIYVRRTFSLKRIKKKVNKWRRKVPEGWLELFIFCEVCKWRISFCMLSFPNVSTFLEEYVLYFFFFTLYYEI